MLIDTPEWVCHGHSDGISAIDVSPNGRRLVTCGTQPQICVWNLAPLLDPAAEADPAVPKLLAALSEHQGNVLVVKFNNAGSLLASGGNDNAVLLYRLAPGHGVAKLGSGSEARRPNIENWRVAGTARGGHTLDVTSLAWTPGDEQLATCSMDGSILVYAVSAEGSAQQVHAIRHAHGGWVKGLAFDPLGRYLASQGRNGLKVWDTAAGWALAAHMREPFRRTPEATFRLRISWTADGEVLLAVNASDAGRFTVASFTRQSWACHHMVGHTGSVVAAAANPRLFYAPKQLLAARKQQAERARSEAEGEAGSEGSDDEAQAQAQAQEVHGDGFHAEPVSIFAAGSNDTSFSVWCSEAQLPLLHCKQLHVGQVVDCAWTPDGYTLITASNDDSIGVIRFSEAELGRALSQAQYASLMAEEYGAAAGTAAGGAAGGAPGGPGGPGASEAPVLDADMAALLAHSCGSAAGTAGAAAGAATPPAAAAAAAAAAPGTRALPAPLQKLPDHHRPVLPPPAAAAAPAAAGSGAMLEARLMPTGAGAVSSSLQQAPGAPGASAGQQAARKRLQPVPVRTLAAGGAAAAAAAATVPTAAPAPKRLAAGPGPCSVQQQLAPSAAGWRLAAPLVLSKLERTLFTLPPLPGGSSSSGVPVLCVAENGRSLAGGRGGGAPVADVCLQLGGASPGVLWRDKLPGQVVAVAGTSCFTAAATASGLLHTWRPAGNMLLPPLALGSAAVSLAASGEWQLHVVGQDGAMMLLDLESGQRQLAPPAAANLYPLLARAGPDVGLQATWVGGAAAGAADSSSGSGWASQQQRTCGRAHMAVLTDGSGWLFHAGFGLWLCLSPAPGDLLGSLMHGQGSYVTRERAAAAASDAERLRTAAAAAMAAGGPQAARAPLPAADDAVWQRKACELQQFQCLMLADAQGYERWLGALLHELARQGDQGRLKELAQDLLGPERWTPAWPLLPWQPTVLGLGKRDLLRRLLVPAAARARLSIAVPIQKALEAAEAFAAANNQQPQLQPQPQPQPQADLLPGLRLGPPVPPALQVTGAVGPQAPSGAAAAAAAGASGAPRRISAPPLPTGGALSLRVPLAEAGNGNLPQAEAGPGDKAGGTPSGDTVQPVQS